MSKRLDGIIVGCKDEKNSSSLFFITVHLTVVVDIWKGNQKGLTGMFKSCMVTHTYSKSMDQPGKVANPARGQLNRGK